MKSIYSKSLPLADRRRSYFTDKYKVKHSSSRFAIYEDVDEQRGHFVAVFFVGKREKPVWHIRFNSFDRMREKENETIDSIMKREEAKRVDKQNRIRPCELQVGDILNTSWGYEQTNVEYYQVTKLVGKRQVVVQEIAKEMVDSTGWASGHSMPIKDKFIGVPIKKTVSYGTHIKINSSATASPWEGKPNYVSWYG